MSQRLDGHIAIITGAGRGIGAATATLFASHGAHVVLASRTRSEIDQVAATINNTYGKGMALAVPTNVACEHDVESLFQKCADEFGPADIVVNNAGYIKIQPIWETSLEDFQQTMNTNVQGVFLCSRAAFLQMKRSGKQGSIIQVSSLSGIRGTEKFHGMSTYVASKHAVIGLTESLSVEGRALGIRVNCIAPGSVKTRMLHDCMPQVETDTLPETIAESILYFADPKASPRITGAVLEVYSND